MFKCSYSGHKVFSCGQFDTTSPSQKGVPPGQPIVCVLEKYSDPAHLHALLSWDSKTFITSLRHVDNYVCVYKSW